MRLLTDIDHQLLQEEAAVNPGFGRKLGSMLDRQDGLRLIEESARRAILNELDGSFPGSKGEWTVLRKHLNIILRDLPRDIETSISKLSLEEKTRMLEAYAHGGVQVHAQMAEYPVEALGFIAEAITAVVGAASSIYGAKLQSDTQKQIAKIQAAGEARNLDAQMSLAKAQMALQAAQIKSIEQQTAAITSGVPLPGTPGAAPGAAVVPGTKTAAPPAGVVGVLTKDIGGGVPLVVPVVGVLGVVLYFVFKG